MKLPTTILTSLIAFATLAQQGQAPAPVLLRRTFSANAVDTYKVEEKVQELVKSPLGEMPVNIVAQKTMVLKTVKFDAAAGNAQIETTTTTDKQTADGQVAALLGDKPAPSTLTGKIDLRGRVTLDGSPRTEAMNNLLSGSTGPEFASHFIEFPEKAVKIGDAWDVVVPKSPLMNADADNHLTAKLEGERELDGVPVWVVSLKGDLNLAVDTTKMPRVSTINLAIRVGGTVGIVAEGLVEKTTGRTLSMTTKGTSKTTIELVESGVTLDTQGTIESSSKLQKTPA